MVSTFGMFNALEKTISFSFQFVFPKLFFGRYSHVSAPCCLVELKRI